MPVVDIPPRPQISLVYSEGRDQDEESRLAWRAIFRTLSNWLANPSLIADEDGNAPSRMTIRYAQQMALELESFGYLAPTGVVPNALEGVTFIWNSGPNSHWVQVDSNGNAECILIKESPETSKKCPNG
jgi:hypothetical protein